MQPTLRPAQHLPTVYLYRNPIDFRKSHNGLSALIEMELGHSPFSGHLYAFTNKQRNKIKCLFWEDNGFVLYYKSLAEEKFKWPKRSDEARQDHYKWELLDKPVIRAASSSLL